MKDKITIKELRQLGMSLKEITIKEFEAREIITFNEKIQNNLELSYGFLQLENSLEEIAPILASNRFGIIISKNSLKSQNFDYIDGVFVFNRGKTKINIKFQEMLFKLYKFIFL